MALAVVLLWLATLACWLFAWLDGVAFLIIATALLAVSARGVYLLKSCPAWGLWGLCVLLLPVLSLVISGPIVAQLSETALSGGFGYNPKSPIPPLPTGLGTTFFALSGLVCLMVVARLGSLVRTRND